MAAHAGDAAVVFMPLALRDEQPASPFSGGLDALAAAGAVTAFCLAARDVELDAEPESGVYGVIPAAQDATEQAEVRVRKSDAAVAQAERRASKDLAKAELVEREAQATVADATGESAPPKDEPDEPA